MLGLCHCSVHRHLTCIVPVHLVTDSWGALAVAALGPAYFFFKLLPSATCHMHMAAICSILSHEAGQTGQVDCMLTHTMRTCAETHSMRPRCMPNLARIHFCFCFTRGADTH